MVNLIRKYQQGLMIVVTVVIIVCFVWFYNGTQIDKIGTDRVATVYGRSVSIAEFQRAARKFEVGRELMLFDLLQALAGNARSMEEARENFVLNTLVLRHEADQLGIVATDDEVVTAIQQLPAFQTNGGYDSNKYHQFVSTALSPNGFSADQLEELVRDQMRLEKLKSLIGATVPPSPSEVRSAYEMRNRKTELSFIQVKLDDLLKNTQVTEEDVKKLYEERKEALLAEEKRKVRFVAFTPPKSETPLGGKERVEALSKLADQAQEFAVAMTTKDVKFDEVAAKFNVTPAESPEFTRSAPPAELGSSPQVAEVAFKLTEQEPNSDVITTEDGYYVLHLAGIAPSRPLTFEEAQAQLTEQLKQERAREAMELKVAEIRNKILTEQKAGKSFAEAAAAAGVKVESFPAFSLMQPPMSAPNAREIITASVELPEGRLSDSVQVADGAVLVHVDKRLPIDEEEFKKESSTIAENVGGMRRDAAFLDWLSERRAAANITKRS